MKRLLLLGFLVGIIPNIVLAQDYYSGNETVTADSITFEVRFRHTLFSLENVENEDRDPNLYYKNGTPLEVEYSDISKGKAIQGTINRAFVATFTEDEYHRLQQLPKFSFGITYVVDSAGNTLEVRFVMSIIPEMLAMPPSKFAQLEKNLKKYVKWDVSVLGRKLQYIYGMTFVNFSRVKLDYSDDGPKQWDGELILPKDPNSPGLADPTDGNTRGN